MDNRLKSIDKRVSKVEKPKDTGKAMYVVTKKEGGVEIDGKFYTNAEYEAFHKANEKSLFVILTREYLSTEKN